jgi:hypothetical protein
MISSKIRVRYSLRFLLISFLVLASCFAWLAIRVQRNGAQRRAVEQLWRMGGMVAFEGESDFVLPASDSDWTVEREKTWLHDALVTRTPTQVLFAKHPPTLTDDDVQELVDAVRQLPTVQQIRLDGTMISRQGILTIRRELPHCTINKYGIDE